MSKLKPVLLALALIVLALVAIAPVTSAREDKSMGLYVNLATKDTLKAGHAFAHAMALNERGHPIAFFLNGDAVLIAARNAPQTSFQGKSLQAWLKEVIAKGAKVIVCRVCMGVHGMSAEDLVEGTLQGSPELVSQYLFDPTYKVISW